MFGNLGHLTDLLKNAGKIQESMQKATESLGQVEVEGESGGGSVVARTNGRFELVSLKLDPKLLADGDVELLEDLIVSAVNAALIKSREAAAQSISSIAGGLPIPGLSHLFGGGGGSADLGKKDEA